MSLATCVEPRIRSYDDFCGAISQYIDVPGQTLNNGEFTDEEFEAVAQLNDAFNWPDEQNWVEWREGLRQIFHYSQLSDHQLRVLDESEINLSWLQGAPFFLHIANDDQTQVAYLPERTDYRNDDRMMRGRVGRFLTNHLNIEDEALTRLFSNTFNTENYQYILTRDPEEIVRIYKYGPRSCMSGRRWNDARHPARAYGSGDFAMLATYPSDGRLDNPELNFNGRALISIASGRCIRIYGNNESIEAMLGILAVGPPCGYRHEDVRTNFKFDRFLHISRGSGGYTFPYLDIPTRYVFRDPLAPQRGEDARWRNGGANGDRTEIKAGVMSIGINSQTGGTRARRMYYANQPEEWPETVLEEMADHDNSVEEKWEALNTRFQQATTNNNDLPRVIRPILWNNRPQEATYDCPICGENKVVAPDFRNVLNDPENGYICKEHTSDPTIWRRSHYSATIQNGEFIHALQNQPDWWCSLAQITENDTRFRIQNNINNQSPYGVLSNLERDWDGLAGIVITDTWTLPDDLNNLEMHDHILGPRFSDLISDAVGFLQSLHECTDWLFPNADLSSERLYELNNPVPASTFDENDSYKDLTLQNCMNEFFRYFTDCHGIPGRGETLLTIRTFLQNLQITDVWSDNCDAYEQGLNTLIRGFGPRFVDEDLRPYIDIRWLALLSNEDFRDAWILLKDSYNQREQIAVSNDEQEAA